MDRASKWHPSPEWTKGVPICTEDRCPEYDGKRCKMMGFRPCRICEPVVQQLSDDVSAATTSATQAEELLRDREKDLEFEHGRSEAFEGACEAIAVALGWPILPHPENVDQLVAAITALVARAEQVDELVARIEESEADNRVLAAESNFADIAAVVLKDAKAKNYVEIQLDASDGSQYVLTFQRRDGETPHQLRAKAEAEVARLRELLREWWESSKLSCGDGTFLAWHDSFSRQVRGILFSEPPGKVTP